MNTTCTYTVERSDAGYFPVILIDGEPHTLRSADGGAFASTAAMAEWAGRKTVWSVRQGRPFAASLVLAAQRPSA